MKHTPGPWIFHDIPGTGKLIKAVVKDFGTKKPLSFFRLPIEPQVSFNLDDGGKLWGTIAYNEWVQFPSDNFKLCQTANAKLIAAAPELIEACKIAKKYLENDPDLIEPGRTVFWKLVEAIQKATE